MGLHKRFRQPGAWLGRLDRFAVDDDHWARLISPEPFDLAALLKARGSVEPTVESVLEPTPAVPRRPRQKFGEMGIPPGSRLIHPQAPELEVLVVDDVGLLWRGEEYSLSSLTRKLRAELGLSASRDIWRCNGRSLRAIYDETYGPAL